MKEAGFDVGMSLEDVSFASMDEIHSEFQRLSKSDEQHMQRLHKNNEMRETLKKKLGAVVDNALHDSSNVNDRLKHIHEEGKAKKDASLIESLKDDSLRKDKLQELEELSSVEEIESALDELAKHINKKINSL